MGIDEIIRTQTNPCQTRTCTITAIHFTPTTATMRHANHDLIGIDDDLSTCLLLQVCYQSYSTTVFLQVLVV